MLPEVEDELMALEAIYEDRLQLTDSEDGVYVPTRFCCCVHWNAAFDRHDAHLCSETADVVRGGRIRSSVELQYDYKIRVPAVLASMLPANIYRANPDNDAKVCCGCSSAMAVRARQVGLLMYSTRLLCRFTLRVFAYGFIAWFW